MSQFLLECLAKHLFRLKPDWFESDPIVFYLSSLKSISPACKFSENKLQQSGNSSCSIVNILKIIEIYNLQVLDGAGRLAQSAERLLSNPVIRDQLG